MEPVACCVAGVGTHVKPGGRQSSRTTCVRHWESCPECEYARLRADVSLCGLLWYTRHGKAHGPDDDAGSRADWRPSCEICQRLCCVTSVVVPIVPAHRAGGSVRSKNPLSPRPNPRRGLGGRYQRIQRLKEQEGSLAGGNEQGSAVWYRPRPVSPRRPRAIT